VKGRLDHSQEMFIMPRQLLKTEDEKGGGLITSQGGRSSIGCWVVTPFQLSDRGGDGDANDTSILVNRGWVSNENIDQNKRQDGQVTREVELLE
jgi:cytochrome oxidase assembly protein ShyY1